MIVSQNQLANIRVQNRDKKIVLTSGTFDLFHIGHLNYLKAVKAYGDIVVVMLSGDNRIQTRKGIERPIFPENERAQILDALKTVDFVFIDPGNNTSEHTDSIYTDILANLQPDIYATDGEDIRLSKIIDESKYVTLPRVKGGKYASTTAIVEHITKLS